MAETNLHGWDPAKWLWLSQMTETSSRYLVYKINPGKEGLKKHRNNIKRSFFKLDIILVVFLKRNTFTSKICETFYLKINAFSQPLCPKQLCFQPLFILCNPDHALQQHLNNQLTPPSSPSQQLLQSGRMFPKPKEREQGTLVRVEDGRDTWPGPEQVRCWARTHTVT